MDTCSRLGEPGGVGWKDVNVGRLRTTTSGKRSISWHRAAARSARWPRNLAFAIPYCGVGWNNVWPGGSSGGGCPVSARERAAAHGGRHFKKNDRDLAGVPK